eukprot:CAMPEP_0206151132 /NCGR_PEP_ID=MMETSP1473-20131121/38662_1 /ASSEMBLY_ACC=CAM_ASM_001109 /TAXON_ID=1461547 /ORGANISM="Stichococcus sp, Strain RCC1054" /LENGTH=197 /DNA_ID=CAMNT_0053548669 /DNA_START=287 /DNA_END=880 /DNA_ORIENTATION=+
MPHVGKPLPGGQPIKPQPWWAGIGQSFTGAKESWTKQWAVQQRSWKKHKKFQMPVKVDVDFLNPVVATVKESAQDIWAKMPQPVQQHGPIISAVLVTALIVHNIEKGRLRAERERNLRLRGRVDLLLGENEELHKKVSDLKGKAQGPRSPSELAMSRALSEATQAAAAAATAAAHAASACGTPLTPNQQPQGAAGSA